MKRIAIFLVCIWAAVMSSCIGKKPASTNDEKTDITGRWVAEELVVRKDYGTQQEVRTVLPVSIQGKNKPTETIIEPQGTFKELHFSATDSLLSSRGGHWHQYQDSLYLTYSEEGAKRSSFGLEQESRQLRLKMAVDYDGDGKKDDLMEIVMKRQ